MGRANRASSVQFFKFSLSELARASILRHHTTSRRNVDFVRAVKVPLHYFGAQRLRVIINAVVNHPSQVVVEHER
jgi:hypothetical protein